MSSPVPARPAPRPLVVGLLLAAAAGGVYLLFARPAEPDPQAAAEMDALRTSLRAEVQGDTLAAKYTDADGDLVADPPPAGERINPARLVFGGVAADDPATAEAELTPALEAVSRATGKPVVFRKPPAPPPAAGGVPRPPPPPGGRGLDEHLADLRAGRLHVVAFTTGQVPAAVATAGFVPLAARADAAGSTSFHMELIVPAASRVRTPADLKGQTLGLVALSSHSGGKLPLVLLKKEFDLLPGRDFKFAVSGGHERSVAEVAAGRLAAAAVAGDVLQKLLADNTVPAGTVRSVYRSGPFPRVCFGVSHALDPEVQEAVKAGLVGLAGGLRFAAVDYKTDWQDVREIDRKLAGLLP